MDGQGYTADANLQHKEPLDPTPPVGHQNEIFQEERYPPQGDPPPLVVSD